MADLPLDIPVNHGEGPVGHLALIAWLEGMAKANGLPLCRP
jgi:hypothetical protein